MMTKIYIAFLLLFLMSTTASFAKDEIPPLWQVRSVDTMKTSRDLAREKLHNKAFDAEIKREITLIKTLGANYVAIDTPYDAEFLPYLKRWVDEARAQNLHIWYRGNWSNWEGWFEYPKNLSPEEHTKKTVEFIESNLDLFQDGDAFDPCPECENSGHWRQPEDNEAYLQFVRDQNAAMKKVFAKHNKNVHTNWSSIIGGRAKDVFDQKTFDSLNNLITIDHYIKDPNEMGVFVRHFYNTYKTNVLIGEFGAPIPDLNGNLNEVDQAKFIDSVLNQLYINNDIVIGMNYWVLAEGTTRLVNFNGTERDAYDIIKKYYQPGMVKGNIKDNYGTPVRNAEITVNGVKKYYSDSDGNYSFSLPAGDHKISVAHIDTDTTEFQITVNSQETIVKDVFLKSNDSRIKHWFKNLLSWFEL